jgi:hypothetical protein
VFSQVMQRCVVVDLRYDHDAASVESFDKLPLALFFSSIELQTQASDLEVIETLLNNGLKLLQS